MFEDDSAESSAVILKAPITIPADRPAIEITRALIEQFQKEVTAIITPICPKHIYRYLFESIYEIGWQRLP
ncbi:hypothetical protein PGT21_002815 [Puccinia graminis f. sp. tritici]|uniref:Uncharacterized protein n=1 Tax=Puccinia graminis f. sp. tritici TaxID=56615 RepID=A0A5B0QVH3_PUCGR|nr:hypothetical protein PGT21_002815 [Puccinia graminis f. sp. tritici]